ncbi:hypothetical protein [Asaia bogorensis]|uniref:Uncharacterized protein n=1 Tax=Asaia bogorensis NBRC 16594 TaxID=1231624 RepID=A0AAN4R2I2_9PROT|nr:hypothetical protein [Asaia bogorensis]BAT20624.1 general secretion pathway protein N [Asaia bogorensis NBRC 16594]GBQ76468.1 hypothetical protein AA0311_1166 [Asaia bogorensis NBRC 16594]GEL53634.1 hypothetical protein ABO01nite_16410 [Asaia bogorensis NBRC 16594]
MTALLPKRCVMLCAFLMIPHAGLCAGPTQVDRAAWQDHSLARPLFAPTRRPSPTGNALAGTPRLTGIIENGGVSRAIFMIPGQERGVIVPLQGYIGNWQVIAIGKGTITIREAGQDRLMRPDRARLSGPSMPDHAPQSENPLETFSRDELSRFAPPASSDTPPPGMPQ